MKRILSVLIIMAGWSFNASAQHENTIYFMQSIPQSGYFNPALRPNYKVSIGLPGISSTSISVANTGFSYKDVVNKKDDDGNDWINLNNFYNGLKKKNFTKISASSDLFSLGVRVNGRMHATFNITEKVNTRLLLPKGLFWFINGNAPEVAGTTIQMGPKLDAMHYREYAIGTSYIIDNKLTIGVRGKMLFGKSNVHTEESIWTLTTGSEMYDLTVNGSANIQTSGIDKYVDDDADFDAKDYLMNKKNKGFAIDLGATYKVKDKLTLGVSIVDLGSIMWKDNTKNYVLPRGQASYSFDGFDVKNEEDFEAIGDSIDAKFKFQENTKSYKTGLPTKFYLSGNYSLFRNCYLGMVVFGEIYQKNISPSFSASVGKDFGRTLSLSLSYTAANRSFSQAGGGFAIKLWPMQIYFISDNIITTGIAPKSAQNLNARLGINFLFGRVKAQEKQTYK
jgi:hypothetical protein